MANSAASGERSSNDASLAMMTARRTAGAPRSDRITQPLWQRVAAPATISDLCAHWMILGFLTRHSPIARIFAPIGYAKF